jgi:imidazolonepropionase-like amidohydrolase
MMRPLRIVCVGLALCCLGRTSTTAQTNGAALFEGARLIVGDGSTPIEDSAFVVENGVFTRVGRRGQLRAPAGAIRVDLSGATVIPGLIDAHAHLGNQRYSDWTDRRENYTRENILDQLNRASFFGLSAVYSAGSDFGDFWYVLRDEIISGKHPTAARWVPGGMGLTSADAVRRDKARQDAFGVDTAAEARRAVQELAARGVKIAKAWVEGRPGRGGTEPLRPEAYEAFIDEAHKHHMRTYVHAHDLGDAKRLLRAGNDGFAHKIDYPGPDAELLAMLKERGPKVYMTLTQPLAPDEEATMMANPDPLFRQTILPVFVKKMQDDAPKKLTGAALNEAESAWAKVREMTRKFIDTGIRIGVGTDTVRLLPDRLVGWGMHVEMDEMVRSGMTPAQVIVAATKTNAEWLGLDDLGTIQPGKTATFVVLDANPLDDITNTRRIRTVYTKGRQLDRARLSASWGAAAAGR